MPGARSTRPRAAGSEAEFDEILALPPRRHEEFATDVFQTRLADANIKYLRPFARYGRALLRN